MKKTSLLFVVPLPPPWAGVEQMSQTLLDSSLRDQFNIDILKSNVRDSNATKGQWDLAGMLRVFSIGCRLAWRCLFSRPDLIYMTLSQNLSGLARDSFYILIARFFGRPVVAHLHGSQLTQYFSSRSGALSSFFRRRIENLDSIVVCAKSIKKDIAALFPGNRIDVVYNAVRENHRHPGEGRDPINGIPGQARNDGLHVFFMGHLSVAKGFYDLIAVAQELLAEGKNMSFTFAGERLDNERNVQFDRGEKKQTTWSAVEAIQKNHPENIQLVGIVTGEEKKALMKTMDLFVLPSYAEAFPVSVLEAMGHGLPLLVTPVGALPEILKDGENCLFVSPGQPESIKKALLKLYESKDLRRQMRENNKDASKRFSIDQMAQTMGGVFNQVLIDRRTKKS